MQMIAESLQHLVQRPEDYLENVQNIIKLYKETALPALEVSTKYVAKNGDIDVHVLALVK